MKIVLLIIKPKYYYKSWYLPAPKCIGDASRGSSIFSLTSKDEQNK